MAERCPLAAQFKDPDLGSMPNVCRLQCGPIWEEAISAGDFFVDELVEGGPDCCHPNVDNNGEEIVREGQTSARFLVLFENCTSCGEEVQTTQYKFDCPYENV